MSKTAWTKTKGYREARDIIAAAEEQGWTYRPPTSRSNSHGALVPSNGGPPVGVASTPSDVNFRHQIVRQLRKGGFIWPPPSKIKIKQEETEVTEKVVLAARDQGWVVEDDGKEFIFVPPANGGRKHPTIKIPNTKGCGFFDLQNLRRAGLIYPWTPPDRGAQEEPTQDLVGEIWRQMDYDCDFEISNAGRGRKTSTGKLLPVYGSGAGSFFKLSNNGRAKEKNIRGLVIAHFGHPPLKNVALTEEVIGHRSGEVKALLEEPAPETESVIEDQENDEVIAVVEDPTTRELEDGWAWVRSEPEVIDGYAVSVKGDITLDGKPRTKNRIGVQYWVSLRRFDNGSTKSVRLDKLILRNFVGTDPFEGAVPIHKDGDTFNCELDNLEWPTDALTSSRRPKRVKTEAQAEPLAPVEVPDEAAESMEPEPPVDLSEPPDEAREVLERMEADLGFETDDEDLELPEEIDVPVQAKGIEQLVEEGIDDYTAPEPKPKRTYKKRAKTKGKVAAPVADKGVTSGRYWQHYETGLVMYVGDDGVPEFPEVTTAQEGKALLQLAALAQEWIAIMGVK